MPISFHPLELTNEPLLRLKLVDWEQTGETSLSVAFCHLLGSSLCLICPGHSSTLLLSLCLRRCIDAIPHHDRSFELLPGSPCSNDPNF
jgi:hypothetical protein